MTSLALVSLGHCQLAIPHHYISTIESLNDAQADDSSNRNYWTLPSGGRRWALYSLDTDLQPQRILNSHHTLALCFKSMPIAITCDSIASLSSVAAESIPPMMRQPDSCISGFILHQQSLVLQIDMTALANRFANTSQALTLATTSVTGSSPLCNVQPGI